MSAPPAEELRCPTCGARQVPSEICRRCKSDLGLLCDAIEARDHHHRAALLDLGDGRPASALRHARRCHELRPGPDSRRLLAVCRLLLGDWPGAMEEAPWSDQPG